MRGAEASPWPDYRKVSSAVKLPIISLRGHIALSEVAFGLPGFLIFLYQDYSQGTLTLAWATYLAVLWTSLAVVGAAILWFTVTLPLVNSRKR